MITVTLHFNVWMSIGNSLTVGDSLVCRHFSAVTAVLHGALGEEDSAFVL